jgi:hypothetical protein
MKGAGARGGGAATFSGGRRRRPPSSRVAGRATIRASEASEDIPASGRERAEGFPLCGAVAVAVAVTVAPSAQSERAEGVPICGAVAVAVITAPRSEQFSHRS